MARPRLTARQNEAYEFIRSFTRQRRKPPTLREIADALGLRSLHAVHKLLAALERKGYLRREPHAARGLELLDDEADPFALDPAAAALLLVGRASSAQPATLRRRPAGTLVVDPRFLEGADEEACLVIRAGDDGMAGEGIRRGDFLVVEEGAAEAFPDGATVAALLGETFVVRRLARADGRLCLRPSDRSYTEQPVLPDDPTCHVVGRVRAVLRKL